MADNDFRFTSIDALYAVCAERYFLVRDLSASHGLNTTSVCELSVICEVPDILPAMLDGGQIRTSNVTEMLDTFKYGAPITVYQSTSNDRNEAESVVLFDGFIQSVGSSVSSGVGTFAFMCKLVLCTAESLYTAANDHMQAVYLTATNGNNAEFTTLDYTAKFEEKATEELSNPTKYAADIIDGTLSLRTTNVSGGFASGSKTFDKLASFIDLENAPKLNTKLMVADLSSAGSAALQRTKRNLAKLSVIDIVQNLGSNSGLTVLNSYIHQFGLVLAPRIGEKSLAAIMNIGINSKLGFTLKASSILSHSLLAPRNLYNHFQAIAVRTTAQGEGKADNYILWSGGYDAKGKPKLSAGVKLGGYKNFTAPNSAKIQPIGPITIKALPVWLTSHAIPTTGTKGPDPTYEKYASALAKTYFGRGRGTAGRLRVGVVYTELTNFYNRIGEQVKIELTPSEKVTNNVKLAPVYGRLVGVSYSISGAGAEALSAACELTFDCVCTEEEYEVFKISDADLLCTNQNKA